MDTASPRQVSYYGPIYIRNSFIELPGQADQTMTSNVPKDTEEVGRRELIDISKYRIRTPSPNVKHEPQPYVGRRTSAKLKPKKRTEDRELNEPGSHRKPPNPHSVQIQSPTNNHRDGNTPDTNTYTWEDQRAMPLAKYEEIDLGTIDTPNPVVEDCVIKDDCPFKISSTEDNYVRDNYKLKSRCLNRGKGGHGGGNGTGFGTWTKVVHQRSKSNDETKSASKDTNDLPNGRDFLSRHRKRIAKLKRRFFESQSPSKSFVHVPMTSIDAENTKGTGQEANDTSSKLDNDETLSKQTQSLELDGKNKQDHAIKLDNASNEVDQDEVDTKDVLNNSNSSKRHHKSNLDNTIKLNNKPYALGSGNNSPSSAGSRSSSFSLQERRRRFSADTSLVEELDFDGLKSRWAYSGDEYAVVIAIDFGTTYSGYAYSFVHDPETIYLMRRHESGEPGIYDQKIPTTILLTPEGMFHSFGYAARDFYHELEPKEANKWLYFDRFKMMLHNDGVLRHDSVLRTMSGKEISALKVFAYSLAYFKDLAIQEISDQSGLRIATDVIRWVITVPAIWKASAKQFMRQAAYEAGIVSNDRSDQLLIALEPEAASIYCRSLRLFHVLTADDSSDSVDVTRSSSWSLSELKRTEINVVPSDLHVGARYMVVDCGGGTVDITVHELVPKRRLKELQRATGGAHGSVGVDEEFVKLLGRIFGHDILDQYRRRRPSGWVELMAGFESRKRTASPYRASSISVSLPFSFIDFFKKCRGSAVETAIKKYGDHEVTWTSSGMLRLSPTIMKRLFRPTVDRIKQAIGDVLNNPNLTDIEYMFLAGGFAESSIVQHELRKDFGSILKIIIPPGVAMTVLKGAVSFGLDPYIVNSRCSCLTYGVGVLHRFDLSKHPTNKKVTKDHIDWCTDVFDSFVRVNQSVELGESIVRRYTPVRSDQTATTINIYSSDTETVAFITDPGVSKCGTLTLRLSDSVPLGQRREIRTEMMFGDTEIRVRAVDVSGGHSVEASVDFINI